MTQQISAYGMTELSPMATSTSQDDNVTRRLTSAGRVVPHSSVKIVDRNNPRVTLQTGEKGEILVGGYLLMEGYWNDTKQTSEAMVVEDDNVDKALPRRWLRTGDEGMIDESGYLTITGRIKDIIIRGGENIYPREIEDCLEQVAGVVRAAVVGLPDKKLGEVTAAFIEVAKDAIVDGEEATDAQDLRAITADPNESSSGMVLSAKLLRLHVQQHLAKHLIPKYVFWVAEMPLTASGKIQKQVLKHKVQAV